MEVPAGHADPLSGRTDPLQGNHTQLDWICSQETFDEANEGDEAIPHQIAPLTAIYTLLLQTPMSI